MTGCHIELLDGTLPVDIPLVNLVFTSEEHELGTSIVRDYVARGIIEECEHSEREMISQIFFIPKRMELSGSFLI